MLFSILFASAMASFLTGEGGNKFEQKAYVPENVFVTKFADVEATSLPVGMEDIKKYAKQYLSKQILVSEDNISINEDSYCSGDFCHIYFSHVLDGLKVKNHNANMNFHKGKLISMSYDFTKSPVIDLCAKSVKSASELKSKIESELGAKSDGESERVYYDTGNGVVSAQTFKLQKDSDVLSVVVDECTGEIVELFNMTLH
jgi:hypothetical protein